MLGSIHSGHIVFAAFIISVILAVLYFMGVTVSKAPRAYKKSIFKDYVLGSSIMNESERQLYYGLLRKFGGNYHVCPKVRIEDVIQVRTSVRNAKQRMSRRGRISSRHFDALVTDKRGRPAAAFEFDGPTHFLAGPKYSEPSGKRLFRFLRDFGSRRATRGADRFKNELCAAVSLPLYRISYKKSIEDQINAIRLR